MTFSYWADFLVGLLGGFGHCLGMCGGFVLTYSFKLNQNEPFPSSTPPPAPATAPATPNPNPYPQPSPSPSPTHPPHLIRSLYHLLSPHLLYNTGRLFTYAILGQIFGFLGGTLGVIFAIQKWQGALQIFAGIIMLAMGLDFLGLIPSLNPDSFFGLKWFKRLVQKLFDQVSRSNIFFVGMVLGLVPCGLVYAMGARAAATESIIGGMMTMLAFGLGTFPAMILAGLAANLITLRFRRIIYRIAALIVMALGTATFWRGTTYFILK